MIVRINLTNKTMSINYSIVKRTGIEQNVIMQRSRVEKLTLISRHINSR